ncbi:hypothetical protein MRB53_000957 [Persea americana]|uniref:Uncharacterized protein n=1 Tax=Persea americana TaxID=3435 RepID=A0ACC2MQB8_PERAE|nr:hypothetical protein MRB53_000957 [Persea americana]
MLEMVGRSMSRLSVLRNPQIQRRLSRKPAIQESLHLPQLFSLDRGLGFRQLIFREKAKRVLPAVRPGSNSQRLIPRLNRILEERVKDREMIAKEIKEKGNGGERASFDEGLFPFICKRPLSFPFIHSMQQLRRDQS